MKSKHISIQSSYYPLGYNKTKPMTNFNSWARHIHHQLNKINSKYLNRPA